MIGHEAIGSGGSKVIVLESVTKLLTPLCDRFVVRALADSGHYPMQEAPPRTVAIVERFPGGAP